MIAVGDRYQNLYFAARQGNWAFAAYQVEETEEAMEHLAVLEPKHKTGLENFVKPGLKDVEEAVKARDMPRLEDGVRAAAGSLH